MPLPHHTAARVVVSDDPSRAITVTTYGTEGEVTVPVSPVLALGLAMKLIEAARRRLP